jgi:hypothetical protein
LARIIRRVLRNRAVRGETTEPWTTQQCHRHLLSFTGEGTTIPAVRSKKELPSMCDYSLHHVANRPARVGDKLVTTRFGESSTRGFAAIGEPNVAVCLLPGTEIAFDREVDCDHGFGFLRNRKVYGKLARFRQINTDQPGLHRDALEFPDGEVVLLTRLCEGQHATVLQLPASRTSSGAEEPTSAPVTNELAWSAWFVR